MEQFDFKQTGCDVISLRLVFLRQTRQTSGDPTNLPLMSLCQKRSEETRLIHMVEPGRFVYNTIRHPSLLPAFFLEPHKARLNLTNSVFLLLLV